MNNPEKYEYILPGDFELQPKHRSKLDRLVGEAGMNNTEAQAFIDLHVEITNEFAEGMKQAMTALTVTTGAISSLITAVILTILVVVF